MDNSNRPSLRAYVGGTGSGKGVSVREHLKADKPGRLLVWDPLSEYSQFCRVRTGDLAEVARLIAKAGDKGDFSVAYWPGADAGKFAKRFEVFCRIAFAAGNCTVLIEELADVTKASWAPQPWGRLVKQGRHRGLKLIGCTQRPAGVDKTFLGNTTYVRCFMLRYPEDQKAMAGCMGVPLPEIEGLETIESETSTEINFMERDFRTRETNKGRIKLTRK